MKKYVCFASICSKESDVKKGMNFDPLNRESVMSAKEIEGNCIAEAMRKFINTSEFKAYFDKHKDFHIIHLYYLDEEKQINYFSYSIDS